MIDPDSNESRLIESTTPFEVAFRTWAVRFSAAIVTLVVIAPVVGSVYEQRSSRQAEMAENSEPRGEMTCTGEGGPTVLFFLSNSVPAVGQLSPRVEPAVAEFATVCRRIYVRAYDWEPPTGERLVAELHDALAAGNVNPPYVLVGWSMGGLVARWFDARFPDEVAGFVFVDSSHPDMVSRPAYVPQPSPARLPSWAVSALRETGVLRLMLSEKFPRWLGRRIENRGARLLLSGYFVDHQIMKHARQLDWRAGALGSRPVVVLTKDTYVSDVDRTSWMQLQEEFAALSSDTRHQVVDGSEHAIWVSHPESVTLAIRDVVDSIRRRPQPDLHDSW